MNPPSLTELDAAIVAYGRQLERLCRRPIGTISNTWSSLREILQDCPINEQGRYVLFEDRLNALGRTIEDQYSSKAHQWLAKDTVNLILYKLDKEGALKTAYFNVPHQVPRTLVTTLDGISPTMLASGRTLQMVLQEKHSIKPPAEWSWGVDVWGFLLFYTSLVVHSHVLLPRLVLRLLNVRGQDLIKRGWINLPQRGRREEVDQGLRPLLRFPLSSHTQKYLEALLDLLGRETSRSRHAKRQVFPEHWLSSKWRKRILEPAWLEFMSWIATKAECPLFPFTMGSLIHIGTILALMDDLPPFAAAVHTGEIPVSPMTDASFDRIFLLQEKRGDAAVKPRQTRKHSCQEVSSYGSDGELFQQIEIARNVLHREEHEAKRVRREIAYRISQLIGVTEKELVDTKSEFTALGYNIRCYGLWLIRLLQGKDDNGTVSTRASALAAGFFPHCSGSSFSSWTSAAWVSNMAAVMENHETSQAKASFRRFHDFLMETGLSPKVEVPWQAKGLTKAVIHHPVPLVSPEEFDRILAACPSDVVPARLQRLLRVKMILGFDLGLRSMEATNLKLAHVILHPEPVIQIRITKTAAGLRDLPVSKLMPALHLNEVLEFVAHRYQESGGNLDAPVLAISSHPEPYDSSYLASLVGLLLRKVIAEPLCFHHLRHSFASWFLLRWLRVVQPTIFEALKIPMWKHEVFQEALLSGLRQLLFGLREPKIGEVEFSHALVALCRLLGHSGPSTTLSSYCHTVDILSTLIINRPSESI